MKTLSSKEIIFLKGKLYELELFLQNRLTARKFEQFIETAQLVACKIDIYNPDFSLEWYIQDRLSTSIVNKIKAQQIYKKISDGLKALEACFETDALKENNEKPEIGCKEYNFFDLVKLEILKLQLDLAKQKGFYLMLQNKEKVAIQEDILIVAAHVIQELGYTKDLVFRIMKKFRSLEEYKDLEYVTKTEELVITECYSLLFETLIDLSY